jgi:putative endonuclease
VRSYWTYIMASRRRALYTGVTNDLERRVFEHKTGLTPGFAKKYGCDRLVFFEEAESPIVAIAREKQIKGWTRNRKVALIEAGNPKWTDLSTDW